MGQAVGRNLSALHAGWIGSDPYEAGFGPELLHDNDGDGLMNILEGVVGTDTGSPDTDLDGWSDFGELVLEHDPLDQSSIPAVVVADGNFDDWLDLIPGRILIDEGREERCQKSSDVTH